MIRVKLLVLVIVFTIFVGLLIRIEGTFENPTKNSNVPVGYWKVTDLPKLFSNKERPGEVQEIQFRIEAPTIGIEYLTNGVYQVFLNDVSSFSTLKDLDSKQEASFANQGDFFSRWDDIFVGGAQALIFGTNPDTQELLQYKSIAYSPDFDSTGRELVFYLRIPNQDESFVELFRQADLKMKVVDLKLFESYNLASGGLIVESFSPAGGVFGG